MANGYPEEMQKSYFPYGYLSNFEKLTETKLAEYDDFYDYLIFDNALDHSRNSYRELIAQGFDEKSALEELKLTEKPPTGRELYRKVRGEWEKAGCESMLDVAKYYMKVRITLSSPNYERKC